MGHSSIFWIQTYTSHLKLLLDDKRINMNKTLVICLAVLVLAAVAIAAPFNAVGPFYNGNIAKVPYFAIAEHTWPGLVKKTFALGLIAKHREMSIGEKGPLTSKQFYFTTIEMKYHQSSVTK